MDIILGARLSYPLQVVALLAELLDVAPLAQLFPLFWKRGFREPSQLLQVCTIEVVLLFQLHCVCVLSEAICGGPASPTVTKSLPGVPCHQAVCQVALDMSGLQALCCLRSSPWATHSNMEPYCGMSLQPYHGMDSDLVVSSAAGGSTC